MAQPTRTGSQCNFGQKMTFQSKSYCSKAPQASLMQNYSVSLSAGALPRRNPLTLLRKSWHPVRTTSANSGNSESLICKKSKASENNAPARLLPCLRSPAEEMLPKLLSNQRFPEARMPIRFSTPRWANFLMKSSGCCS